jgi:hypothetical protein
MRLFFLQGGSGGAYEKRPSFAGEASGHVRNPRHPDRRRVAADSGLAPVPPGDRPTAMASISTSKPCRWMDASLSASQPTKSATVRPGGLHGPPSPFSPCQVRSFASSLDSISAVMLFCCESRVACLLIAPSNTLRTRRAFPKRS